MTNIVAPAPAGMSRWLAARAPRSLGRPRASGDEPAVNLLNESTERSPPRQRG